MAQKVKNHSWQHSRQHGASGGASASALAGFLRLRVGLFAIGLAVTGYLLFNEISWKLWLVVAATFLTISAVYAYNQITDKKEDLANRRRSSPFAYSASGYTIVAALGLGGIVLAAFLSPLSGAAAAALFLGGLAYSWLRIKSLFLLKNLLTVLGFSLVFVIGVAAGLSAMAPTPAMLKSYVLIFSFILSLSLIADLRDFRGDKKTGVKSLPVTIGFTQSKAVVGAVLFSFAAATLGLGLWPFAFLLPFTVPMAFFLGENRFGLSHLFGLMAGMLLPLFLLTIMMVG